MREPKPLIVMALPQESRGLLEGTGAEILFTGVGKVNAAGSLARRLAEMRCTGADQPLVVNLGTAGSRRIPAHTLVACNRFAQRDMDVSGMGLAPGVTPFDSTPSVIEFPVVFADLPQALAGTEALVNATPGSLSAGDHVTVGIRPEHMEEGGADAASLRGTIDAVEQLGESSYVYMRLASGDDVIVRAPGETDAAPGGSYTAHVPRRALHVFDASGVSVLAGRA